MLEGTRTTRLQTNRGVLSHLMRNDRRVDLHPMLVSVGLHVVNTNPLAMSPMQSFITEGDLIATTPCHRDKRGAVLVQLRGPKELLLHPPTSELPGCPAHVFDGANKSRASRWLWGFDPFQLAVCHTSSWVKVVLVLGRAVTVPGGWWHAVRSTPSSVAISVAVQVEQTDERVARGHRVSR